VDGEAVEGRRRETTRELPVFPNLNPIAVAQAHGLQRQSQPPVRALPGYLLWHDSPRAQKSVHLWHWASWDEDPVFHGVSQVVNYNADRTSFPCCKVLKCDPETQAIFVVNEAIRTTVCSNQSQTNVLEQFAQVAIKPIYTFTFELE